MQDVSTVFIYTTGKCFELKKLFRRHWFAECIDNTLKRLYTSLFSNTNDVLMNRHATHIDRHSREWAKTHYENFNGSTNNVVYIYRMYICKCLNCWFRNLIACSRFFNSITLKYLPSGYGELTCALHVLVKLALILLYWELFGKSTLLRPDVFSTNRAHFCRKMFNLRSFFIKNCTICDLF